MLKETFVILSIALVNEDRFLLELVEKRLILPRKREDRWRERDSIFPGTGTDENVSPYAFGRNMVPIVVPLSLAEFNALQPRVGQEISLRIDPVGI